MTVLCRHWLPPMEVAALEEERQLQVVAGMERTRHRHGDCHRGRHEWTP